MKANIIQIGNSKGLRLSKTILEKYDIKDTVEISFEEDCIVLKSDSNPRKGWEKHFRKCIKKEKTSYLFRMFFLVNLDPIPITIGSSEIKKTRPCLVISPIEMNKYLNTQSLA